MLVKHLKELEAKLDETTKEMKENVDDLRTNIHFFKSVLDYQNKEIMNRE